MKRAILASALLCAWAADAWASPLPPDQIAWNYNWSPGAPAVYSDGGASAGVSFTDEPTKVAVGSSDVVATNLRVSSSATAQAPDFITGSNGNYSLKLQLSVNDGGKVFAETLTFTGRLFTAGHNGFSAENANVANEFLDDGPKVADLGPTIRFTVTLTAYTPPGPPDQSNAGSIAANVVVENVRLPVVPEPSALALSWLGGAALLAGARRRGKARRAGTE